MVGGCNCQPLSRAGRRSENARRVISTDEAAIRKPLSCLIHLGDTTLSERGFLQTGDELNATDMLLGQPVVVGDEQLHLQSCRTGQLDGTTIPLCRPESRNHHDFVVQDRLNFEDSPAVIHAHRWGGS
jgi:hypothetical protein